MVVEPSHLYSEVTAVSCLTLPPHHFLGIGSVGGGAEGTKRIEDLRRRRDNGTMDVDIEAPVEGSVG